MQTKLYIMRYFMYNYNKNSEKVRIFLRFYDFF